MHELDMVIEMIESRLDNNTKEWLTTDDHEEVERLGHVIFELDCLLTELAVMKSNQQ